MKLCLKNIGKMKSACVDINGITVIAGNNDTGKSTIGKALFAIFNSLYRSDEKIVTDRADSINNLVEQLHGGFYWDFELMDRISSLLTNVNTRRNVKNLKKAIWELVVDSDDTIVHKASEESITRFLDSLDEYLRIDDDEIFKTVLQKRLDAEFNEQTSNQFASREVGEVTLVVRNEQITIQVENNKVQGLSNRINLGTEAIYIDDPFVLDEIPKRNRYGVRYASHRDYLLAKLRAFQNESSIVEEIVATNKLNSIYRKLSVVCPGDIVRGGQSNLGYKAVGWKNPLKVQNLSTGLKTFVILKMLLTNGHIKSNGTVILDEPEIHLHPEWQLLFAEIIVLLHCEFGLHILLNTHSPYFLNAIEVYSAKYGVDDKCKYYLAREDGDVSYIDDVTDNTEAIYEKLARPLQVLENERYSND